MRGRVCDSSSINSAEVVLYCKNLQPTVDFFVDELGFVHDTIFPAEQPRVVILSGYGTRLRLEIGDPDEQQVVLRLSYRSLTTLAEKKSKLTAPNGTRIHFAPESRENPTIQTLVPSLVINHESACTWTEGRAGMMYRDLIPGRQGGRFIASHIRIPQGGPVSDYVHYHRVRFQIIYCIAGWVRVIYEGAGKAFVMRPGDFVVQPPKIRHRVLESSDGLEVVEVACPAEYETKSDHDFELPGLKSHTFSGQKFLYENRLNVDANYFNSSTNWQGLLGFRSFETGVKDATRGLVRLHIIEKMECEMESASCPRKHDYELYFLFVCHGELAMTVDGREERLVRNSGCVIPSSTPYAIISGCSKLKMLELSVPSAERR